MALTLLQSWKKQKKTVWSKKSWKKTFQRSVQVAKPAKGGGTQHSGPCQTKRGREAQKISSWNWGREKT